MPYRKIENYCSLVAIHTLAGDLKRNSTNILKAVDYCYAHNQKMVFFAHMAFSGHNLKALQQVKSFIKKIHEAFIEFKSCLKGDMYVGLGLPLLGTDDNVYECYVILKGQDIVHLEIVDDVKASATFSLDNTYTSSHGPLQLEFNVNGRSEHASVMLLNKNTMAQDTKLKADFLICPYALPYGTDNFAQYQKMTAPVADCFSYALFINLLGNDSGYEICDGQCFVTDNKGTILQKGSAFSFDDYSVLFVKEKTANIKQNDESDLYQLSFRACALGLFDYMLKSRSKGYVVSLSGGADSAVCASAAVAAHALALSELKDRYFEKMHSLGFNLDASLFTGNVEQYVKQYIAPIVLTTVYQGSVNSSDTTFGVAKNLAENLNATFYNWRIDTAVDAYVSMVQSVNPAFELTFEKNDLAMQSIQARARLPGLWLLTNVENKLLIATSNRSEGAVGYCTMDGDTAGSISPIGAINKSILLKLIACIAKDGVKLSDGSVFRIDALSPLAIMSPTAELRPGGCQKDEDDLMPYALLDAMIELFFDRHKSPGEIYTELKGRVCTGEYHSSSLKADIRRFFSMCFRAQWKRERLAPAFSCMLSTDFALPVLSGALESLLAELDTLD